MIRLLYRSNVAFTTKGLSGRLDMVEPTSEKDIFAFLDVDSTVRSEHNRYEPSVTAVSVVRSLLVT